MLVLAKRGQASAGLGHEIGGTSSEACSGVAARSRPSLVKRTAAATVTSTVREPWPGFHVPARSALGQHPHMSARSEGAMHISASLANSQVRRLGSWSAHLPQPTDRQAERSASCIQSLKQDDRASSEFGLVCHGFEHCQRLVYLQG